MQPKSIFADKTEHTQALWLQQTVCIAATDFAYGCNRLEVRLQQTLSANVVMAATDYVYGCNRLNILRQQTIPANIIFGCNRLSIWLQQTRYTAATDPVCKYCFGCNRLCIWLQQTQCIAATDNTCKCFFGCNRLSMWLQETRYMGATDYICKHYFLLQQTLCLAGTYSIYSCNRLYKYVVATDSRTRCIVFYLHMHRYSESVAAIY